MATAHSQVPMVFLSGAVHDMAYERRDALDAIWRCDMQPLMLERASASDVRAVEWSLQLVDQASVYLGIIGTRYGSVLPDHGVSLTELEYRRARARGIPTLIFLADYTPSFTATLVTESPTQRVQLEEFKRELQADQLVYRVSSREALARMIVGALATFRAQLDPATSETAVIREAEKIQTSTSVIFVSYRRADTVATCLHLAYRLEQHFGASAVYMDEGSIPPGADWRDHIKDAVAQCGIMLAVIGHTWLQSSDDRGQRRLDDENDVLRQEIESAIQRRIPVIPVLVDDAPLPRPQDLPESLRPLCNRQSLRLRNSKTDFGADVRHIIEASEYWISPLSSTA